MIGLGISLVGAILFFVFVGLEFYLVKKTNSPLETHEAILNLIVFSGSFIPIGLIVAFIEFMFGL